MMKTKVWGLYAALTFCSLTGSSALAQGEKGPVAKPSTDNLADEVRLLREQVRAMQASVGAMQDGLEKQLEFNDRLQRQIDEVSQKLESVASSDGQNYFPNLLGNMQRSPEFRAQLMRATQGKLSFNNTTGAAQRIFINGAQWEVIPGRSFIHVPYGRVQISIPNPAGLDLTTYEVADWTVENEQLVLRVPLALNNGAAQQQQQQTTGRIEPIPMANY